MTGDFSKFSTFTKKDGGLVNFRDNAKGKIIGIGNVDNSFSPIIENVLFVDNLKHNLLSISQLCDKVYRVVFKTSKCLIENACSKEVIFVEKEKMMFTLLMLKSFQTKKNVFQF